MKSITDGIEHYRPENCPAWEDHGEDFINGFKALVKTCNDPGYENRINGFMTAWDKLFSDETEPLEIENTNAVVSDLFERVIEHKPILVKQLYRGNGCPVGNPLCDGEGIQQDEAGVLYVKTDAPADQLCSESKKYRGRIAWCACRELEDNLVHSRKRTVDILRKYIANLPDRHQADLKNLNKNDDRFALSKLRNILRGFKTPKCLVILGDVGIGKTAAMNWIIGKWAEGEKGLLYPAILRMREFAEDVGQGHSDTAARERVGQLINSARSKHSVFGIDDLGSGRESEVVVKRISEIIDVRHSHNQLTVITSNLHLEDLYVYGSDVIRRLFDPAWSKIVKIDEDGNASIMNQLKIQNTERDGRQASLI